MLYILSLPRGTEVHERKQGDLSHRCYNEYTGGR